MLNNDIFRRVRYIFNFNDKQMRNLFKLGGLDVNQKDLVGWLKKEDDEGFVLLRDHTFASFLNGFIVEKRGKKDGVEMVAEKQLNNNIILTKLKIALALKAEDILDILQRADFRLGKAELSAFFRKADHRHFRECKDQILRNFLVGLQNKHRNKEK